MRAIWRFFAGAGAEILVLDLGKLGQGLALRLDLPQYVVEVLGRDPDRPPHRLCDCPSTLAAGEGRVDPPYDAREQLGPCYQCSPIPVDLHVETGERPGERIEATAYFVASEALANAIKHSGAAQININVWRQGDWIYVRVSDNGRGGADAAGGGLSGLRARVEAVDGRLLVDSPTGGPTIIDAWLPSR